MHVCVGFELTWIHNAFDVLVSPPLSFWSLLSSLQQDQGSGTTSGVKCTDGDETDFCPLKWQITVAPEFVNKFRSITHTLAWINEEERGLHSWTTGDELFRKQRQQTRSPKTNDKRSLTPDYSNLPKFRTLCESVLGASLLLREWWCT